MKAIIYAFLAAVFYAINIPASKVLLRDVGPTTMAALLYLGAGIGIALLSLAGRRAGKASAPLSRQDLPFTIGMIVLDIAAPIFLMLGIRHGTSANASLLGIFEIVAMPDIASVGKALALGFVAYGLSIFLYVRAQNTLGAAKTSAYYAVAPFVGAFLSFVFLKEGLSWTYLLALAVMLAGAALVVVDTLLRHHTHQHQHTFTHFHGGMLHSHTITHTHEHDHFLSDRNHNHRHPGPPDCARMIS